MTIKRSVVVLAVVAVACHCAAGQYPLDPVADLVTEVPEGGQLGTSVFILNNTLLATAPSFERVRVWETGDSGFAVHGQCGGWREVVPPQTAG